jgi:hypothetical protein
VLISGKYVDVTSGMGTDEAKQGRPRIEKQIAM